MVPAAQTRKQQLGKLTGLAHSHAEGPAELPASERHARRAPEPGRQPPPVRTRGGAGARCGPGTGHTPPPSPA